MMSKAMLKYLRVAPRKVQVVARAIRGAKVEVALDYLKFCPRRAAKPLFKLVRSALANAGQKKGVNVDKLVITELLVNEGPTMKRTMPRAKGSADQILKRSSHVTIVLGEK